MREIIFKARRLDNGEWVLGDLNRFSDGRAAIADSQQDWFLVDPETVCEYTGGKDRSGQRIFEGDTVRLGARYKNLTGIVNFNSFCFCLKLNTPDAFGRNNPAMDIIENEYPNEIVVIGNIHDSKVVKTYAQADSV